MKRLLLLALTAIILPAAEMPPQPMKGVATWPSGMASLEGLPADLRQLILLHTGIGPHGILNIPALAKGITNLAATNKKMYAAVNNPQNMLIILKSLPRAGAVVLANGLRNMPGMKSDDVKNWLKSFKLTGGQKLVAAVYKAADPSDANINAIKKMLADPNIAVNEVDYIGNTTALLTASTIGYPEIVEPLLAAGADVNAKNSNGSTPLMLAIRRHSPEVVNLLLAAGADVNTKDKQNWTPLMLAGINHYPEIVKILLVADADLNAKNKDGDTPLSLTRNYASKDPKRANDYKATIKLLEDAEKAQKEKTARK